MGYCNQTLAGIQLDCSQSLGGIKTVYIANYGDVVSVSSGETITEITMSGETKFKPYQFRKQTGSMTSTLNVDESAGINYVTTEVSLVFTKMETSKRLEMSALAIGQLAVIVEDSNNKYWFLGEPTEDYVAATAGGGNTGQNKGDQNAYLLTLTTESKSFPREVDKSVIDTITE